jgi:hypothetical protein
MPKVTKRKTLQESSEAEDFGNDDFTDSDDNRFSSDEPEIIIPEVPFEPIIVDSERASRSDYAKVNVSLLNE